jgi:hypothetical protein
MCTFLWAEAVEHGMKIRNVYLFFGKWFWHGANWTIAWGFINALYFLPLLLLNKNRSNMEAVSLLKVRFECFLNILSICTDLFSMDIFRAKSIG